MGSRLLLTVSVAALLVAACADDRPDTVVELGQIDYYSNAPQIEAPATAAPGQPFVVRVTTYGGGCISQDVTDVEIQEDGADVRPYDRRHIPGPNEGCEDILFYLEHEAALTFETTGPKVIRIHGRRVAHQLDEAIKLPVTVVVE